MASTVAAAIDHPSAYSVRAAPGAFLVDLRLARRGVGLEILSVIGEPGELGVFQVVQRISQRHFAMPMMVPVRFSVRRDMHQLVMLPFIAERAHEPVRQHLPTR